MINKMTPTMNTAYSFKINTSKWENTFKSMTRVVDNFTAILRVLNLYEQIHLAKLITCWLTSKLFSFGKANFIDVYSNFVCS